MNIFVLNTGRSGSSTFAKACQHISNYTCGHESRHGRQLGEAHFSYPDRYIEVDNRLSWFLGRLDKHYGDHAFYVHLKRNNHDIARSFSKRYSKGIIKAYRDGILRLSTKNSRMSVSLDYCDTVHSNIELFLKDKTRKMDFNLENARQDFKKFWEGIGAEGDLNAALSEFETRHNASLATEGKKGIELLLLLISGRLRKTAEKLRRFYKKHRTTQFR